MFDPIQINETLTKSDEQKKKSIIVNNLYQIKQERDNKNIYLSQIGSNNEHKKSVSLMLL